MSRRLFCLGTFLISALESIHALQVPNAPRTQGADIATAPYTLASRESFNAKRAAAGIALGDVDDNMYTVNITLGGQEFAVQLDSGSTDLWVQSPVALKLTNDSGLVTGVKYGTGEISGPIQFAELKIGEYTIPSQAFINVNASAEMEGTMGILGVSMDLTSADMTEWKIKSAWGNDTTLGRSPLANIFHRNMSSKPFFDVSLGRALDLDQDPDSIFVIGDHAPGFASVEQAPKLLQEVPGRWTAVVDGLSVNGINFTSANSSQAERPTPLVGNFTALMDTGTNWAFVPPEIADFIYGNIPGAVHSSGLWYVPCNSGANLTWYIGGQAFPMHPLDVTKTMSVEWESSPNTNITIQLCFGVYQGSQLVSGVDIVLGDIFLRNVYISYNFGDNTNRTLDGTGSYIQMLSTTDPGDAWLDFQLTKMALVPILSPVVDPEVLALFPRTLESLTKKYGLALPSDSDDDSSSNDNKTSPAAAGALAGANAATSSGSGGDKSTVTALLDKYGPVVIGLLAGNLVVALLLVVIGLVAWMRRDRAKSRRIPTDYAPVSFKEKVADDSTSSEPLRGYGE